MFLESALLVDGMTFIIHIAERLLAQFSKMIYSSFFIENSMAAILSVWNVQTYTYIFQYCSPPLPPPPDVYVEIHFMFQKFFVFFGGVSVCIYTIVI
jgi:hypothetical protein